MAISAGAAQERLPAVGVPYGTERGAVEMECLEHFAPNLSGPASDQAPCCRPHDEDEDDAEDEKKGSPNSEDEAECPRAPDALIAEENANAEFLIGLDGSPDDDAVGKLAAYRAKVQLAEDFAKRINAARGRVQRAGERSARSARSARSGGRS